MSNVIFHDTAYGGYWCSICNRYIHPDMVPSHNAPNHGKGILLTNPIPTSANWEEVKKSL